MKFLIHKKNCILINDYKNEKVWLKQISKISKNIKKYDKIRQSAFGMPKNMIIGGHQSFYLFIIILTEFFNIVAFASLDRHICL